MEKRRNCSSGEKWSNFSSFPQYFRYISKFKSSITYKFVKCGCLNYFLLTSANLICRGTDISKYFRESLGIRDNEIRLYNQNHSDETKRNTRWRYEARTQENHKKASVTALVVMCLNTVKMIGVMMQIINVFHLGSLCPFWCPWKSSTT